MNSCEFIDIQRWVSYSEYWLIDSAHKNSSFSRCLLSLFLCDTSDMLSWCRFDGKNDFKKQNLMRLLTLWSICGHIIQGWAGSDGDLSPAKPSSPATQQSKGRSKSSMKVFNRRCPSWYFTSNCGLKFILLHQKLCFAFTFPTWLLTMHDFAYLVIVSLAYCWCAMMVTTTSKGFIKGGKVHGVLPQAMLVGGQQALSQCLFLTQHRKPLPPITVEP